MKGQNDEKEMEKLLLLYCQGATTPEECMQVERWINQSEENLRVAKQLYQIIGAISDMKILKSIDTAKALKRTRRLLLQRQIKRWSAFIQKAAALLFLPLLFLYFFQWHKSTEEIPVPIVEVRSANGATTRVTLPDNTVVCLNSHSVLRYPQQFDTDYREVTLDGEGYFEVIHQASRPFIVRLPQSLQVEVLGTTFNVEAYSEQNFISTTLVEGHVNFLYQSGNSRKSKPLSPGQKVVYDINKDSLSSYQVDCRTETSWKDGILFFNNTPLPEVIRQLEKHFDISIDLKEPKLKEYTFTGRFVEQSPEPILESIKAASGIRWRDARRDTTNRRRHIELYSKKMNP